MSEYIRMDVKEPEYKYICRCYDKAGQLLMTGRFMTKKDCVRQYDIWCAGGRYYEVVWCPIRFDPLGGRMDDGILQTGVWPPKYKYLFRAFDKKTGEAVATEQFLNKKECDKHYRKWNKLFDVVVTRLDTGSHVCYDKRIRRA